MENKTVRRKIFLSNTFMVLAILCVFLLINILIVKLYGESIEHQFMDSVESSIDEDVLEDLLREYTIRRNEFLFIILADGVACITVLVLISQIFTKRLADHIMIPLNALEEGAIRIRNNDLTQDIEYEGDAEFEDVCDTFNDMRKYLLAEQEKNRKYEKARVDMIAGISHDLRTPLTVIQGTIKGMMDGIVSTPEQKDKFLVTAYKRTLDMDVLLNQLFYMSRLETGNLPLDFKLISISDLIENYVRSKQDFYLNEEIEVSGDTNGVTGMVNIDPEQFLRIFDNLLENSRKYSEAEHLKVKISLNAEDDNYLICFSDNGVGVSEEKLPYIFDEFYRADESRNKKEGNGLGLYIVKYLVEAMGGSVTAESSDGFSVCIKLKKQSDKVVE